MRSIFILIVVLYLAVLGGVAFFWKPALWSLIVMGPLIFIGIRDMFQARQTVKRNFPVIGHFRYILEMIRPEIQQYFIETNEDGKPFSREQRSVMYQRAKKTIDTVPFGTQLDLYEEGYEWINHSMLPKEPSHEAPRVVIGQGTCKKPYSSSLLNISAMSYGSLSKQAVLALNHGAKLGGFAHNTGEGGVSEHHQHYGGDLIWQIGTGYFGCRNSEGRFSPEKFKEQSQLETIRMIEVKISQGAKPGHGGILPGSKVTPEIAKIRGVEVGKTVNSPPYHSAFTTPVELLEFVSQLRDLSGGKPVGIKICVGKRRDFLGLCKAMLRTGMHPDYIVVDGAEGGTGAAPLEFTNTIGTPLTEGLILVANGLKGIGFKDKVKVVVAGKIHTGFNMASKLALGADLCYSARGMMFALGCIQALRCNTNDCPTGIATQHKGLAAGLDVADKSVRVKQFHEGTIKNFLEVLGAAGLDHPSQLKPWHIMRRTSPTEVKHYGDLYPYVESGEFLDNRLPQYYERAWRNASPDQF